MVYLGKRQTSYGDDYDDGSDDYYHGSWWYSDTGEIIKWAIIAALFFGIFLFLALGSVHARRRVRRGQAPLRYHRWLLPRSLRRSPQQAQPFTFYQHQQNPYEMHPYPAPPPAYHHNEGPPPPQYEPPQGASKMNPNQTFSPPPGPPPAGEASNAYAAPEIQRAPAERFDAVNLQGNDSQLPPRPQSSSRSWNPLKRLR
ncbi:MAG: hypothetical protein Q9168_003847 [Polycauliona sp. 1 TL-2023]